MKNWDQIDNYMVPQQLVYICFKMWDQNEKKLQNIVEQKHGTKTENYDVVQQHRVKCGIKMCSKCGTKMCSKCWTLMCSKCGTPMYSKCGTKMCSKCWTLMCSKCGTKMCSKCGTKNENPTSSHFVVSSVNFFVFKFFNLPKIL